MLIKTAQGIYIDLPLFVHERTNNHLAEFGAARRRLRKTINDIQKDDSDEKETPIPVETYNLHLLDICQTMCGDAISGLPFFLPEDDKRDLIKEKFMITINSKGQALSIERIFAHLINMLNEYKPNYNKQSDFVFEWYDIKMKKGKEVRFKQKYYLNAGHVARVLLGTGFTSGETIETMELQRLGDAGIKKTLDLSGNLSMTLEAKKLAVLVRPNQQPLPSGERERREHIKKYTAIFAEVPINIVFDVAFFLRRSFSLFVKTEIAGGFSRKGNQTL